MPNAEDARPFAVEVPNADDDSAYACEVPDAVELIQAIINTGSWNKEIYLGVDKHEYSNIEIMNNAEHTMFNEQGRIVMKKKEKYCHLAQTKST